MRNLATLADMKALVGQEVAVSAWFDITQERITLTMADMKMGVNYGLNKVRLPAPVPAGSRVRARLTIQRIDDIEGGAQVEWGVVIEREGGDKPVCVAELLMRRY